MGLLYSVVANEGYVPPIVLKNIPERCECGAEIEFDDGLNMIYCPNPTCSQKVASRIHEMLKELDVGDIPMSICVKLVEENDLVSPLQLFDMPLAEYAFADKLVTLRGSVISKEKAVKCLHIKDYDESLLKLIAPYPTLSMAVNAYEQRQVPLIMTTLDMSENMAGVATSFFALIMKHKAEFKRLDSLFHYSDAGVRSVCIAGKLTTGETPTEYLNRINATTSSLPCVSSSSVTKDCDVLVCDYPSHSTKEKKAEAYNIPIYKSSQLD